MSIQLSWNVIWKATKAIFFTTVVLFFWIAIAQPSADGLAQGLFPITGTILSCFLWIRLSRKFKL